MYDIFQSADDYHEQRRRAFEKLATDPPCEEVVVGSRVLLSAFVLGMGLDGIVLEAKVLEVADTAYYVQFKDRLEFGTKKLQEEWIHRVAVTDVLESESVKAKP